MKELSIEEKAKRYDEAIEIARKFATDLPNGRNDRLYHVWDLESIFPELKESVDEKINREITEFLVDFNNGEYERPSENTIDSWLAWIEKQGELVNSLSKGLDNAHERIDGLIQKNNSLIEQLEKKQGEQMLALNIAIEMEDGDILKSLYNDLKKLREE